MKSTKTTLEVLQLMQTLFERKVRRGALSNSLCITSHELVFQGEITILERLLFEGHYKRSMKLQNVFYDCNGKTTRSRDQFGWPLEDRESRQRWLRTHIENLKNKQS
jgi:hypothetical protein